MLELSYSRASVFRSCQKKYYWKYIQGLEPIIRNSSLTIGSILHEGFDMFYKGGYDNDVIIHISKRFDEEMGKEEVSDQEDLLLAKYTTLGMWLYYPYKKIVGRVDSEEEFKIPLCEDVIYVGKVDGRITKFDNTWIRELKTTGLNTRQFEGRCSVSTQATGYVWGVIKNGHDVKGIMYEYVRKPILRKGVKESADDFGRRIIADYKARPQFYYNQHLSYRTPVDLKNFEEDTVMIAHDIINTTCTGKFSRNQDQCFNFNSACPYMNICFSENPDPLTLELYFTHRKEEEDGRTEGRAEEGR